MAEPQKLPPILPVPEVGGQDPNAIPLGAETGVRSPVAPIVASPQVEPITLPNGNVLQDVPMDWSQEDIMQAAYDLDLIDNTEYDNFFNPQPLQIITQMEQPNVAPIASSISVDVNQPREVPVDELLAGLPEDVQQRIISDFTGGENSKLKSRGQSSPTIIAGNVQFDEGQLRKAAEFEYFRLEEPGLAQVIDETQYPMTLLIGAGGGFKNILQGARIVGEDTPEDQAAFDALKKYRPSAAVGEFIGEAAPFAATAPLAFVRNPILRMAMLGVLGGTEGYTAARGRGESEAASIFTGGVNALLNIVAGGLIRGPSKINQETATAIEAGKPSRTVDDLRVALDAGDAEAVVKIAAKNTDNHATANSAKSVVDNAPPEATPETIMETIQQIVDEADDIVGRTPQAGDILTGANVIIKNPALEKAIAAGLNPAWISRFPNNAKIDKEAFRRMLRIFRKGTKDLAYAINNRPTRVLGDTTMRRYDAVEKLRKEAGEALNKAAKELKGKPFNGRDTVTTLLEAFQDQNIRLLPDGKLDFSNSAYQLLDESDKSLAALKKLWAKVQNGFGDAEDAHMFKKAIDNGISDGKTPTGQAGAAESIMIAMRRTIDDTLDATNDAYRLANEQYSDTVTVLNQFQKAVGKSLELTGEVYDPNEAVGTALRRIMSNAQSRVPQLSAIDELERVARKYDIVFTDSVTEQAVFVNEMEKMFGSFADTGFAGQVAVGAVRAGRGDAVGTGVSIYQAVKNFGKSEDVALTALEELIK